MFTEVSQENPKENGKTDESLPREGSSNENLKDTSQSTKEELINENWVEHIAEAKIVHQKMEKLGLNYLLL